MFLFGFMIEGNEHGVTDWLKNVELDSFAISVLTRRMST